MVENFVAEIQGGMARRPGTRYTCPVRFVAKTTLLMPFQYNTEQAYIIEFGDLYVRFYRNHGPLVEAGLNISAITVANPAVVTAVGHTYANGDDVEIAGVIGMVQVNRRFRVAGVSGNNFNLTDPVTGNNVSSLGFTPYVSGGQTFRVYTLATVYQAADIPTIKITQSSDTLYVVHPLYVPRRLSRIGATNWSLAQVDFIDGPYLPVNSAQTTLTPAAVSGNGISIASTTTKAITGAANNGAGAIRITSAAHGWNTGDVIDIAAVTGTTEANGKWTVTRVTSGTYDLQGSKFVNAYVSGGAATPHIFESTDIGRLIRLQHASTWGYARIVTYVSAVSVTADIVNAFGATTATAFWRLGTYSQGGGYPACVTFMEDRLCLGGCPLVPNRMDMSQVSIYSGFAPSGTDGVVTDASAIYQQLNSGDVNVIRWMKDDEKGLLIGTLGGEWVVRPDALGAALTPTNAKATRSSTYGSADYQPVRAGKDVMFIQRGQRKIRNLTYVFQDDGFSASDTTILSEHITLGGAQQMAYQAERDSVIWMVRGDGQIITETYSRDQEAIGWARQVMGGASDVSGNVQSIVKSVACIPTPDTSSDEIWLIVQRFINGNSVQYVEWMTQKWETGLDQEAAFYVDAGATFDGTQQVALTIGAGAIVQGQSQVPFVAASALFISTDVGRVITYRYFDYASSMYRSAKARITQVADSQHVMTKITAAFPKDGAGAPLVTSLLAGQWRLSASVIGGLYHLEGQTVTVNAEGASHPDCVVTNGQISLDVQAAVAQIGLGYISQMDTMRLEAGSQTGTSQGKRKRISDITIRFYQTLGAKVARIKDDGTTAYDIITFRQPTDLMDNPPQILDGDHHITPQTGTETQGRISVIQDQPFPMTILAMMPEIVTFDKG